MSPRRFILLAFGISSSAFAADDFVPTPQDISRYEHIWEILAVRLRLRARAAVRIAHQSHGPHRLRQDQRLRRRLSFRSHRPPQIHHHQGQPGEGRGARLRRQPRPPQGLHRAHQDRLRRGRYRNTTPTPRRAPAVAVEATKSCPSHPRSAPHRCPFFRLPHRRRMRAPPRTPQQPRVSARGSCRSASYAGSPLPPNNRPSLPASAGRTRRCGCRGSPANRIICSASASSRPPRRSRAPRRA